jgi:hypothetical protein
LNFPKTFLQTIQLLTGKEPLKTIDKTLQNFDPFKDGHTIGYSQFNEILLMFGYNRVSNSFFQFLVDGNLKYQNGSQITSLTQLKNGVFNFLKVALLYLGNIEFAFTELSWNIPSLDEYLISTTEINESDYRLRHKQLLELERIPPEKTYFLGYKIIEEINEAKNSQGNQAQEMEKERENIIKKGEKNFRSYLISDHMDIYVATSMRLKHEYKMVNKWIDKIFSDQQLSDLNLRWFDPTQAFCKDRIDKGLSEALMLKRAKCTLYLAQETDTLGKDSELASTLAQGKPVIAYVPAADEQYLHELIADISNFDKKKSREDILLEILEFTNPLIVWHEKRIRQFLDDRKSLNTKELEKIVLKKIKDLYNKREKMLRDIHPLGIQVNLDSGVANGLLVVRNISSCVKLIKNIVLNKLEFDLDYKFFDKKLYIILKEKISNCVFRIVTGDKLLTNSFWNFYFENEDSQYEIE